MLVAEIGCEHGGSIKEAKRLIHQAAEAGFTAVKFQAFRAFNLWRNPTTVAEMQKYQMGNYYGASCALARVARALHLYIGWTAFDEGLVCSVGGDSDFLKIAAGDINNEQLVSTAIYRCSNEGIPLVLSVGDTLDGELVRVVDSIRLVRKHLRIVLLLCVQEYPAKASDYNMDKLSEWRELFGCDVGISDHTIGNDLVAPAALCGATWFEKHVTNGRGPDSKMALDLRGQDSREYTMAVKRAWAAIPRPAQTKPRYRRGPDGRRPC